jgi:hypothetical protein
VRSLSPTILLPIPEKCVVVMAARKTVKEFFTRGIVPKNTYTGMLLHTN